MAKQSVDLTVLRVDERAKARTLLTHIGKVRRTSGGHAVLDVGHGLGRCDKLIEKLIEVEWALEDRGNFSLTDLGNQAKAALLTPAEHLRVAS